MAVLSLAYWPNPVLRKVAEPVLVFDKRLDQLIEDMFETMYHAGGVGLAAPQVGVSLQLSVIHIEGSQQGPFVIINPEIIERRGETVYKEGCLSIPGVYEEVVRATWVKVRALDAQGKSFEIAGDDLLGECLQHEIDHLNGKLFIDLLSPIKKTMIRKKFEKYKKKMHLTS